MKLLGFFLMIVLANIASASDKPVLPILTEVKQDCNILGENWKHNYGIKVNSLSDLTNLSAQELKTIKKLKKQIEPLGIIALADYSCVKTKGSINSATVKVFVFKNSDRALSWWKRKYGNKGWKKHYIKLDNAGYLGVDSKQLKKRAVLISNLWITTHHIKKGNEHLVLLDNIISKLIK